MEWTQHYPAFLQENANVEVTGRARPEVEVADIGCGYGGLLFALSGVLPQTLILGANVSRPAVDAKSLTDNSGLEIRTAVTEFVANKIRAMREQAASGSGSYDHNSLSGNFQNISVLRANTMKFLPNFFRKGQLSKIFLCFPDPHFKARKHKARIVSSALCSEYAYVLRPGAIVYTITDVEDLHLWMAKHFDEHQSFHRVEEADLLSEGDQCIAAMKTETEEGKKVERNNGKKFTAYWKRLEDPPWPE